MDLIDFSLGKDFDLAGMAWQGLVWVGEVRILECGYEHLKGGCGWARMGIMAAAEGERGKLTDSKEEG